MSAELRNQYKNECPTIYVSLAAGASELVYRWVEIGAEEEGVPCLQVSGEGEPLTSDPAQQAVVLAHAAARGSRLGVGVGIAGDFLALQEAHMPAHQPVLQFRADESLSLTCRLMGSNAGRLVKRMPFRFSIAEIQSQEPEKAPSPVAEPLPVVQEAPEEAVPADLVAVITRILAERGLI